MGYDITIGCKTWRDPDEDFPDGRWEVPSVGEHGTWDAPNGGGCNERSPAYSGWGKFVRAVGLEDVFFNEANGLMRNHPGVETLTHAHLDAFETALVMYLKSHPREVPGVCACRECAPYLREPHNDPTHDPLKNYNLLCLAWLVKWTRYALTTERPAIENM